MKHFRLTTSFLLLTTFITLLTSCFRGVPKPLPIAIIPQPQSIQRSTGVFTLHKTLRIDSSEPLQEVAEFAKKSLATTGISISSKSTAPAVIFVHDTTLVNEEGYRLQVSKNSIHISAKDAKGAFYGLQSLVQLLHTNIPKDPIHIPCMTIDDYPRFSYRGMHLDVGRHFFPVSFIKQYIDMLAQLKMNTFHWHLTEDQGWRIEIKKYPKLQSIASQRKETLIGHYTDQPPQYDHTPYGGYYTQEEIKEVVAYAQERQVTIIPEIEMPGHSQAAIAAYPELGCTGNPVSVATTWGVFDDIYCPKEQTFEFLEAVIDEVITLFPGPYIHIGGDEAPKTRWKNCAHCQELIQREQLKDEQGLQSYFIRRMERYINSKGKKIIGWDEILEGGLAPNATVMSWRGTAGAVTAAKEGHHVILTPTSHCYFDYYQSQNETEPLAIGGYLPLKKVYDFEPIPEAMTAKEASYVLGAQGNVWTEYMKTTDQVNYMVFPRALALSEVLWSDKKIKDYANFIHRLQNFLPRLDKKGIRYANHLYEIKGRSFYQNDSVYFELKTTLPNSRIRYTVDGSTPTKNSASYLAPFYLTKSCTIKAAVFEEDRMLGELYTAHFKKHLAVEQQLQISPAPHPNFDSGGSQALINGIVGHHKRFNDPEWLGFNSDSVRLTLKLNHSQKMNTLRVRFHNGKTSWIYAPKDIRIQSKTGFQRVQNIPESKRPFVETAVELNGLVADELYLTIYNYGKIPDGRPGAGHNAWLFINELILE